MVCGGREMLKSKEVAYSFDILLTNCVAFLSISRQVSRKLQSSCRGRWSPHGLHLFSRLAPLVLASSIDRSGLPRTGCRLLSSAMDQECQSRETLVSGTLERVLDVPLACQSLRCVRICGNRIRLSKHRWPCVASIPHVA